MLWDIFRLRQDVFVLEQSCLYPDIDAIDLTAFHLYLSREGVVIAYARLYEKLAHQITIGRVVVAPEMRRSGLGHELMTRALEKLKAQWPNHQQVTLSAQEHLQSFYQRCGFETVSEVYDEDGIPHVRMQLKQLPGVKG